MLRERKRVQLASHVNVHRGVCSVQVRWNMRYMLLVRGVLVWGVMMRATGSMSVGHGLSLDVNPIGVGIVATGSGSVTRRLIPIGLGSMVLHHAVVATFRIGRGSVLLLGADMAGTGIAMIVIVNRTGGLPVGSTTRHRCGAPLAHTGNVHWVRGCIAAGVGITVVDLAM